MVTYLRFWKQVLPFSRPASTDTNLLGPPLLVIEKLGTLGQRKDQLTRPDAACPGRLPCRPMYPGQPWDDSDLIGPKQPGSVSNNPSLATHAHGPKAEIGCDGEI